MDKVQSGIYAITNIENGKVYVGSTKDFKGRWRTHTQSLRRGTHYNKYLQHSWNKYGEEVFEFGVIEYLDNLEELHLAEQFWMDIYREEDKVLYNMGKYADNALRGSTMPEEQRDKIRKSLIGHPVTEESKYKSLDTRYTALENKSYPALMHVETNEIISAGNDIVALCRERGWTAYVVELVDVVHRKTFSWNGWRLKDNPLPSKGMRYPTFIHKETGEIIPSGDNLASLCRKLGISYGGMSMVKRGKRASHYGWQLVSSRR